MSDSANTPGTTFLREDWQAWLALRHLLPARLQRVLVHEVVAVISAGRLSVAALFDEAHADHPLWNECWALRPRLVHGDEEGALQAWVRGIVWQLDDVNHFAAMMTRGKAAAIDGALLGFVTGLGGLDFGCPSDWLEKQLACFHSQLQPHFLCLADAFKAAQAGRHAEPSVLVAQVSAALESIPMPLRSQGLKHIADVLADSDAWGVALSAYKRVEELLESWTPPEDLRDVAEAWKAISMQCRAAATWTVLGRDAASGLLDRAVEITPFGQDTLLASANLGLDAVSSQSFGASEFKDLRPSILSAPLLHSSHDPMSALHTWLGGKPHDAAPEFWGVLRRQISLGAVTEMRNTKGWYARSILEHLGAKLDEGRRQDLFEMAMRLLAESGNPKNAELLRWSSVLVDAYVVSEDLLARMEAHAMAHVGARVERNLVLVEVFKTWASLLSPARRELTLHIWRHLAFVASTFPGAFDARADAGRPALKALEELAKKKPELRSAVSTEVMNAICTKLGESQWGQSEAAEAALAYLDALDDVALRTIVDGTLNTLESGDPAQNLWFVTRPAMQIIVDSNVRKRLGGDRNLDQRCLNQILRYGLSEETSPVMVFFHLADFDPRLLGTEELRARIAGTLARVRQGAVRTNASDVTNHIDALLIAPVVAGVEGIRDALGGLLQILRGAGSDRASLGLPHAHGTLMLLADRLPTIRSVLVEESKWLEAELAAVSEQLVALWDRARANPLIFAPFAIPQRTKPHPVLVHNFAFASIRFGEAIGREAPVRAAIARAAENAELRRPIALLHATLASGSGHAEMDSDISATDDRVSFYETIGRRLRQLQQTPREDAEQRCLALVENCLRLGPNPADAAALLLSVSLGIHEKVRGLGLDNYTLRVRQDRSLQLLLLPILELFS